MSAWVIGAAPVLGDNATQAEMIASACPETTSGLEMARSVFHIDVSKTLAHFVIASAAKQSRLSPRREFWIASLRSQ
jgi:hypothetical protein